MALTKRIQELEKVNNSKIGKIELSEKVINISIFQIRIFFFIETFKSL